MRTLGIALALLVLAGCGELEPIAPSTSSGSADFSVYASMGTSITAGWQSGGLVDLHQRHSYAVWFARQAGAASFTLPTVSPDGIPPLLRLLSLQPLLISNAGRTPGVETNRGQATAYHDLGVPYAILFDVADSSLYYSGILPRPAFPFDIVLRHRGTILSEAASLSPTFASLEFGSNEILAAAANGSSAIDPNGRRFSLGLHATLDSVQAYLPNAKLAILTVPDVTQIPYFTTFRPFTVAISSPTTQVPLIGPDGPLGPGDMVLLNAGADLAAGHGFPTGSYNYVNPSAVGTGQPLTDAQVLNATEAAAVSATVAEYNDWIRLEAANRVIALVDMHGLLETARTVGLSYQGTIYTPKFIRGGLFSLDGVHPNDLAHGFLANLMIDAVNRKFSSHIPRVNLSEAASLTAARLEPAWGARPLYPVIEGGVAYYRSLFPPLPPVVTARTSR